MLSSRGGRALWAAGGQRQLQQQDPEDGPTEETQVYRRPQRTYTQIDTHNYLIRVHKGLVERKVDVCGGVRGVSEAIEACDGSG